MMNLTIVTSSYVEDKEPGHSAEKDYKVRYGSNKMTANECNEEDCFSKGVDKSQGLNMRKPL